MHWGCRWMYRPSSSPSTIHASATVKTGSTVEAIDAVEAPTRASPAMNSTIGITVETEAISAIHMTPSSLAWMPPLSSATTVKPRAAPVATLVANASGDTLPATRSDARMKPV